MTDYLHGKAKTESEDQATADTGTQTLDYPGIPDQMVKPFQFLQLRFLLGQVLLADIQHLLIAGGTVGVRKCVFVYISVNLLITGAF